MHKNEIEKALCSSFIPILLGLCFILVAMEDAVVSLPWHLHCLQWKLEPQTLMQTLTVVGVWTQP